MGVDPTTVSPRSEWGGQRKPAVSVSISIITNAQTRGPLCLSPRKCASYTALLCPCHGVLLSPLLCFSSLMRALGHL